MADPRFHIKAGPLTVARLCDIAGAELITPEFGERIIEDVAALSTAGAGDIAFHEGAKNLADLKATKAGACLLAQAARHALPDGVAGLIAAEPQRAFSHVIDAFYPRAISPGISERAAIDRSAQIGAGVQIEAGVVIGANAEIGAGTILRPGVVIEPGVKIGCDGYIGPNVSIRSAIIGDRVMLHGGVGIGHDGYGFAMGMAGHRKLQQLGRVILGDDVEIGANTTVDRGALGDTVIGDGTKIDNLVMIGHNCQVGKHCIITAQCGLAGSAILEDFVVMGAQSGILGHVTVGAGSMLAGRAAAKDDLPPGGVYGGAPAKPVKVWMREMAAIALLGKQRNKKKT